jgi:hypothetical protein
MDRNCDHSQPGGYCLIIGCSPDECPSESLCVEFTTPCPVGEGYGEPGVDIGAEMAAVNDAGVDKCRIISPNRGRTYCLRHCRKNSDCRSKYQCVEPKILSASILDFDTKRTKICVPKGNTPQTATDTDTDTDMDSGVQSDGDAGTNL